MNSDCCGQAISFFGGKKFCSRCLKIIGKIENRKYYLVCDTKNYFFYNEQKIAGTFNSQEECFDYLYHHYNSHHTYQIMKEVMNNDEITEKIIQKDV